jgi:hypothetical protein
MQPAGQDPEARQVPGTATLPLCLRTNASPFWIMLLLVWGRLDNGMIAVRQSDMAPLSLLKIKVERASPANLTRLGAHSDDVRAGSGNLNRRIGGVSA